MKAYKLIFAAVFLFFQLAILIGALMPASLELGGRGLNSGYPAHFAAFFAIMVMAVLLFRSPKASFAYAASFAAIIEILQSFTSYRVFSFMDIAASLAGAAAGLAGITLMKSLSAYSGKKSAKGYNSK